MPSIRFGLRSQFILLSCFLLLLPWLGYEYVWEMEKYLRKGQEKTLIGTTRALATALHERPALFDRQTNFLDQVVKGRDLYAYNLTGPIQLDGKIKDWKAYEPLFWFYDGRYLQNPNNQHKIDDLSFKHMVGKYDSYLYAVFEITDNRLIYRSDNSLSVTRNDYLKIALKSNEGKLNSYIIAAKNDGWVNAFEEQTLTPFKQIQGHFRKTEKGYNIELRFPLDMLGNKLGFALVDKDSVNDSPKMMATSNIKNLEAMGSVLVPSPEIKRIIKGMEHSGSRIWVVDTLHRVLAQSGSIQKADGVWASSIETQIMPNTLWEKLQHSVLLPLYYKILTRPPEEFLDKLHDVAALEGEHIASALKGKSASSWRLTPDNKAVILSAAYPIWVDDKIVGAVIAEETTNGVRTLRNTALEKLFNVILAVMIIGTLVLFFFASRISSRIRALRDTAEKAIDEQGRITGKLTESNARDEIGDLSRTFANIVSRLGGYTHYLENMASRLSHELRTPVAVVRSSLENLQLTQVDKSSEKYIIRATEGINRLNKIITTMSEATRLEQSIANAEAETFSLNEVIKGCMQGYQFTYKQTHFDIEITQRDLPINGVPEFIAQLLDKLISNAVEFSDGGTAITVRLIEQNKHAHLHVINSGPTLPLDIGDHIFDSMVSVRSQSKQKQPHLGLGLYIARLIADYHQGQLVAENLDEGNGVCFKLVIPIHT